MNTISLALTGLAIGIPIVLAVVGESDLFYFCGVPVILIVLAVMLHVGAQAIEIARPIGAAAVEVMNASQRDKAIETAAQQLAAKMEHYHGDIGYALQLQFQKNKGQFTDQEREFMGMVCARAADIVNARRMQ